MTIRMKIKSWMGMVNNKHIALFDVKRCRCGHLAEKGFFVYWFNDELDLEYEVLTCCRGCYEEKLKSVDI